MSFIVNVCKRLPELPNKQLLIDFKNITSQNGARDLFKPFINLGEELLSRISLTNINSYYKARIQQDLKLPTSCVLEASINFNTGQTDYSSLATSIQRNRIISIIEDVTEDHRDHYEFLESSNIFLDKYVKIKDVFQSPDQLKLLLYALCGTIIDNSSLYDKKKYSFQFDFLISASPVGAVLTQSLGTLLSIPTKYIQSLGPRFAMHNNLESLPQSKKYLFIYDFICLGTEYKLMQAIAAYRKFELVGGVGIASLVEPEKIRKAIQSQADQSHHKMFQETSLDKLHSLVYVNSPEINLNYNIYHSQKAGAKV